MSGSEDESLSKWHDLSAQEQYEEVMKADSALRTAARFGSPKLLMAMLKSPAGSRPEVRRAGGVLEAAALGGKSENVRLLMASGFKVSDDRDAMASATCGRRVGLDDVQYLDIELARELARAVIREGRRDLLIHRKFVNCVFNRTDIVLIDILLREGKLELNQGGPDPGEDPPLFYAPREVSADFLREMKKRGANLAVRETWRYGGRTLLHHFTLSSAAVFEFLLDEGIDANALTEPGGYSILELVAGDGNLEAVRVLIARGADPNAGKVPYSTGVSRALSRALLEASRPQQDRWAIAELLLRNGANGWPLDPAAGNAISGMRNIPEQYLHLVDLVLAQRPGVKPDASTLDSAVAAANAALVEHLIRRGAPTDVKVTRLSGSYSGTLLHGAVQAKLSCTDIRTRTPVPEAYLIERIAKQAQVVEVLRATGVDPKARDSRGCLAADYAGRAGMNDLMQPLRDALHFEQ